VPKLRSNINNCCIVCNLQTPKTLFRHFKGCLCAWMTWTWNIVYLTRICLEGSTNAASIQHWFMEWFYDIFEMIGMTSQSMVIDGVTWTYLSQQQQVYMTMVDELCKTNLKKIVDKLSLAEQDFLVKFD